MNKFTPGPWVYVKDGQAGEIHGTITDDDLDMFMGICKLYGGHIDEVSANIALITAAPDLLEALEDIINIPNYWPDQQKYYDKAKVAIAKAKGN